MKETHLGGKVFLTRSKWAEKGKNPYVRIRPQGTQLKRPNCRVMVGLLSHFNIMKISEMDFHISCENNTPKG